MTELDQALAEIISEIWKVLKAADLELEAYKNAVAAIGTKNPEMAESLNAYVASQRQLSDLREKIDQKYGLILETLLRKLPYDPARTNPVSERLQALENL